MSTLAEIRQSVREALDEDIARRWTDGELDRWIFEGARDIARIAETLPDSATLTVNGGQNDIIAPADTVRLHAVKWSRLSENAIYTLEYRDFNAMDPIWGSQQLVTEGRPEFWTYWGAPGTPAGLKLKLYPTPSEDGELEVFYFRLPVKPLADGDEVELPSGWEDVIGDYAEFRALRKDADPRWQEARQLYLESLGDLIDKTRRYSDQAGMITTPSGMTIPGWLHGAGDGWWY